MALDEFRIYLGNPTCTYFPGENVKGKVVIRTSDKIKIKGLLLSFVGRVFVEWTEQITEYNTNHRPYPAQKPTFPKHPSDQDPDMVHVITKTYKHTESLFDYEDYLISDGHTDITIESGKSSHPFSFQLPSTNLPSSFVGRHGKVEYLLVASLKKSWYKSDFRTHQFITVNSIVDLNKDAIAGQPGDWDDSKTYCSLCCSTGPLVVQVHTEARGYCPGDVVALEVKTINLSKKKVGSFSAALLQNATFYAENHKKVAEKAVSYKKKALPVNPGDSETWRTNLQIPRIPPTSTEGCRNIDVQYALFITAHVKGFATGLSQRCPIIIGTVPLGEGLDGVPVTPHMPVRSAPPYILRGVYGAMPSLRNADYNDNFQQKKESSPMKNPKEDDDDNHTITNVEVE